MRGLLARLAAFVLLPPALAACWLDVRVVGPSTSASIAIFSEPSLLTPERLGGFCPATPPLVARFTLVIRDERGVDWRVREIGLRFVDRHGVLGSDLLFDGSDLERLFGSTVICARTTRSFGFSPRFGCVGDPVGAFRVRVLLVDAQGATETTTLSLSVQ